jgi:hypothetical protein
MPFSLADAGLIAAINTSPPRKTHTMNIIEHHDDLSTDDRLDAQRGIIRQSLDQIAADIGMAMRDVGLAFPVYFAIPNSGDALVTMATTSDPPDEDWQRALAIVYEIIKKRIGCNQLQGRGLPCAIANAGAINATAVTAA